MNPARDPLPFVKMEGTGNDFVMVDNTGGRFTGREEDFFRSVCRPRTGVGADGLILVERGFGVPVRMRYFNRDGREAAMCANGARCTAHFAAAAGLVSAPVFGIEIGGAVHDAEVEGDSVRLRMAEPHGFVERPDVVADPGFSEGGFLDTGVPHYVLFADPGMEWTALDLEALAPKYRRHPSFPEGANVNVAWPAPPHGLRVRTFERGVEAETLSCGTGCVASALAAGRAFGLKSPVPVETRGGRLTVEFDPGWTAVFLSGPVRRVFEGVLFPETP